MERNKLFRGQLCPDDNDSLRVAECFTTPWFWTTWYLASAAFVCVAVDSGERHDGHGRSGSIYLWAGGPRLLGGRVEPL